MQDNAGLLKEVTLDLGDTHVKIERLASDQVRLSASSKVTGEPRPVDLTEAQLATLLERAIRAGVVSIEFVHHLKSEFEI